MSFFLGHESQYAYLESQLQQGRLAQTYVFSGPKGIGKFTLAERFAHAFLRGAIRIERQLPDDSVWRRMQAQTHGNYRRLQPPLLETGKQAAEISIDVIRNGMDLFIQSAFEPGGRMLIIDSCDQLTRQAANALLKALEEPPANCLIILINHQPSRLLPTLRSRAHQVLFSPLKDSLLRELSQRQGWNQDFIPLALGAPGTLKQLSNLFMPPLFQSFQRALEELAQGQFGAAYSFIDQLFLHEDKCNLLESTHLLITGWFAQQVLLKARGETGHPLYKAWQGEDLAKRWTSLNQLFQEASTFHLDLKQTFSLVFKILDPSLPLPTLPFSPWQVESH